MKVRYCDTEIALIKCNCGNEMIVNEFGNKCDCGRCYKVNKRVVKIEEQDIIHPVN